MKRGTSLSESDPVVVKGCLPLGQCWENGLGCVHLGVLEISYEAKTSEHIICL